MLKNYYKIAVRNLLKHKFFSIINILGLALSMSVCLILIMLVAGQMSYDSYNSKKDRIYRIITEDLNSDGMFSTFATSPLPMADKLLEDYGGIKKAVRIRGGFGNDWIGVEQNVNIPIGGFFVDPQFINLFEYELESGNPELALAKPNSVVLKKKTAEKLYGDNDPIGKIITIGKLGDYIVTGVLKDNKKKSHIKFEALASLSSLTQLEEQDSVLTPSLNSWHNIYSGWTYIELEEGKSTFEVIQHMSEISDDIYAEIEDRDVAFRLQSLTKITPGPLMANEIGPGLPLIFVYFMAGLALIVMISASFNYVNLSIARGLTRAKEVGIRKVSGASRKQLIGQFLLEAVILSVLALVLSNVILIALRPAFENLNFSKMLHWDLEQNTAVYLISLLFAIVVGLISGFLPATLLSAFKPIKVLKDLSGIHLMSKTGLRKFLIVVQFSISLIFIISVTLVSRQLDFMINSNFGFETQNIVNLRLSNANYQQLKTVMKSDSRIKNVSGATHIPAAGTTRNEDMERELFDGEGISTGYFSVDEDYMATLGLNLVAGNNFQQLNANSNEIILNETGVETFGFNSNFEAISELLYDSDSTEYRIVGVVEDYHHQAMVVHIGPMFLKYKPEDIRMMHIELFADNRESGLEAIDKAFYSVHPDLKYEHQYMDAELKFFYDLLFGDLVKMVTVATILALVIACLGLLGMATYTIETRLKEISIRKVLGASDRQLIYQLSKGFIILLGVAIVLSVPFAWFVNNLWLQEIAYRIEMNIDVAIMGIGILLAVGIVTIGSQTYKASIAAPIDNLRNE